MSNLADIYHYFGGDLAPSNVGDILTAETTIRGQQRVLRRLLTNPGDYIFEPKYGAGLPKWIGQNADLAKIKALIVGQIALEASVSKKPAPVVTVGPIANSAGGGFAVEIAYSDADTGQPGTLKFDVTAD